MEMINFDCPECGHNLEVDARGAGFIVRCPECQKPIQIPELETRSLAAAISGKIGWIAVFLVLLIAFAVVFAIQRTSISEKSALLERENTERLETARALSLSKNETKTAQNSAKEAVARALRAEEQTARLHAKLDGLLTAATELYAFAASNTTATAELEEKLLKASRMERMHLMRADSHAYVLNEKKSIAAPTVSETARGKGIHGKKIVFPELKDAKNTILLKNAEVTEYDIRKGRISFNHAKGATSYRLSDLHPGVIGWLLDDLPAIDPLLVRPEKEWNPRIREILGVRNKTRMNELDALHTAVFGPSPSPAPLSQPDEGAARASDGAPEPIAETAVPAN